MQEEGGVEGGGLEVGASAQEQRHQQEEDAAHRRSQRRSPLEEPRASHARRSHPTTADGGLADGSYPGTTL